MHGMTKKRKAVSVATGQEKAWKKNITVHHRPKKVSRAVAKRHQTEDFINASSKAVKEVEANAAGTRIAGGNSLFNLEEAEDNSEEEVVGRRGKRWMQL